jgi:hypothetical protein
MKEHLLLTGRSQRIQPLTMVYLRVARAESNGIPAKNVKEYGMGCICLGLLPVLVFTQSVSCKASIVHYVFSLGTYLSPPTQPGDQLGKWHLVSFTGECSGNLRIAKDLKLLPDMELSEPYTEVVFDLFMVFTTLVNIVAIFGHKAKASAYTILYNFNRSSTTQIYGCHTLCTAYVTSQ